METAIALQWFDGLTGEWFTTLDEPADRDDALRCIQRIETSREQAFAETGNENYVTHKRYRIVTTTTEEV